MTIRTRPDNGFQKRLGYGDHAQFKMNTVNYALFDGALCPECGKPGKWGCRGPRHDGCTLICSHKAPRVPGYKLIIVKGEA